MSETNPGDLPLANGPSTPQLDPAPQPSTSVPELADVIAEAADATVMRVATVTALEVTGNRRVQLDIASTTWVNRLQDCRFAVGDRVSVLQAGPVMLVLGRLTGGEVEVPIGGMVPFAGTVAPTNWLLVDGSSLSRTTYAALFAVCGTTYGSVDGSHFNLPDMRDRLPLGAGSTYTRGGTSAGAVTLSSANLPGHSHSFSGTSDSQGGHGHTLSGTADADGTHQHGVQNQNTRSDILAGGGTTTAANASGLTGAAGGHTHGLTGASVAAVGGHTHTTSGTTGSTGSGSAFTTTGPYTAVPYIIRAF